MQQCEHKPYIILYFYLCALHFDSFFYFMTNMTQTMYFLMVLHLHTVLYFMPAVWVFMNVGLRWKSE